MENSAGTIVYVSGGGRNCYSYGPQQVFEGVYFDEFEGQVFLEGAGPAQKYIKPREDVWLRFDSLSINDPDRKKPRGDRSNVYFIKLIGRKTDREGRYGMGVSSAEILVDRVLSARLLQSGDGYISCRLIIDSCKP